jgi:hypothetical protein
MSSGSATGESFLAVLLRVGHSRGRADCAGDVEASAAVTPCHAGSRRTSTFCVLKERNAIDCISPSISMLAKHLK